MHKLTASAFEAFEQQLGEDSINDRLTALRIELGAQKRDALPVLDVEIVTSGNGFTLQDRSGNK